MRYSSVILVLGLLLVVSGGCGQSDPSNVAIAVVDLNRIAFDTGEPERMRQEWTSLQSRLREEDNNRQSQDASNYETKVKEFGDDPTEEQSAELTLLRQEHAQLARQRAQQTRAQLAEQRSRMTSLFKDKVAAVAQDVATKRGITIVLAQRNVVLWRQPSLDITQAVLDELRKTGQFTPLPPSGSVLPPGSTPPSGTPPPAATQPAEGD